MNSRKISQLIICIAAAAAILVPVVTLFNWSDYLWCSLDADANQKMIAEVVIMAAVIGAVSFLIRKRHIRIIALGAVALVFTYIHSMLLPAVLSGIYFLAIVSMGGPVTGMAAVIIIESLLSLMGIGTPAVLGAAVIASGILYTVYRTLIQKKKPYVLKYAEKYGPGLYDAGTGTSKWKLLINAVVLTVVLVQIGRASVAVLDYDSLWYGLRSEHVLAPGGSIFEDLGLVGMVYTYSKGFETVTLPLSPFDSYAYIPVFNICLFIAGLAVTWKTVTVLCSRSVHNIRSIYNAGNSAGVHNVNAIYDTGRGPIKKHGDSLLPPLSDISSKWAGLAVVITAVIPGIVNMSVSAKPDIVTWLLQLIMIERFFTLVSSEDDSVIWEILAAYLLSLTMKPTAVIFSTALAGMMLIWWIIDKCRHHDTGHARCKRNAAGTVSSAMALAALCFVWARTIILTGVPFTSVFTGILTALGFNLKYPFASGSVPHRYSGMQAVIMTAKRIARMLLSPEGDDMGHVSIAWCGSIMLVLAVVIIISIIRLAVSGNKSRVHWNHAGNESHANSAYRRSNGGYEEKTDHGSDDSCTDDGDCRNKSCGSAAALLFIPFALLCAVTLSMLSQVDGNYYMTLYSIVIITAMWLAAECRCADIFTAMNTSGTITVGSEICPRRSERNIYIVTASLLIAFQFFIMLLTNWASAPGFTPIAFNKLYYDNEADNRIRMTDQADPEMAAAGATIYDILEAQSESRVLAVAEHPFCLQFKCVVESYSDMTTWGNLQLEDSAEDFIEYLHFAGVDYIYADEEYLQHEGCAWRAELLDELTARGILCDHIYEGSHYLARVR